MTIEDIEDQILLHSNSAEEKDIAHCQAYLELRKKLLDEEFINHLDEHLSEVADFNDRMMTALRTLWEDAQKCFDISKSMDVLILKFVRIWSLMLRKMTTRKNGSRYTVCSLTLPTIPGIIAEYVFHPLS